MGLREKVALILVFIALIQITYVHCSTGEKSESYSSDKKQNRDLHAVTPSIVITIKPQIKRDKRKQNGNYETLSKTFNFPDIEYPTASTPRPPFHLQQSNIIQRNPVQRAADSTSSTIAPYSSSDNKKDIYKRKYVTKPTKKPAITITFPEFGTTPKPYCFREVGAFPDVEYPLSAKDTWKPNYWKQFPNNGYSNEIGRNENNIMSKATIKSSIGSVSATSGKNHVSKAETTKSNAKNTKQASLSSSVKDQKPVKNPYISSTEELNETSLVKIDINKSAITTQKPKSSKLEQINQYSTPAPIQSMCTQSSTPFVLTPYTTLYFDTIPSSINTKTTEDENKSTTAAPKKKKKKKKTGKKKTTDSFRDSLTSPKTTINPDETTFISNQQSEHIYEIESHQLINSHLSCDVSTALAEEPFIPTNMQVNLFTVMPDESISDVNQSESDTCSCKSNNTLSSIYVVTTTPSNLCSDTDSEILSVSLHNNNKISSISNDKNVTSISDVVNTTIHDSTDDKDLVHVVDNVISSNKSLTCDDKINNSLLFSRNDIIVAPLLDEEFTTDAYPDFDENLLPIFTKSTSTLSPLKLNEVDEAWATSNVIEPCKSQAYPDELEQYYIIVP